MGEAGEGRRLRAVPGGLAPAGWLQGQRFSRQGTESSVLRAGTEHSLWRRPAVPNTEPLLHRGSGLCGLGPRRRGKVTAWQRVANCLRSSRYRRLPPPLSSAHPHRTTARGPARKFRRTMDPHRRAHGKAGLDRERFDTSPSVPVSLAVFRPRRLKSKTPSGASCYLVKGRRVGGTRWAGCGGGARRGGVGAGSRRCSGQGGSPAPCGPGAAPRPGTAVRDGGRRVADVERRRKRGRDPAR